MPKQKKVRSLLTATERERLVNRIGDPNLSDEEKDKYQNNVYHNDMVVRNKIKSWLNDIDDIHFALDRLPKRQKAKTFGDNDVFNLFRLVERLVVSLEFKPILGKTDKMIVSDVKGAKKIMRDATEKEIEKILRLNNLVNTLNHFYSPVIEDYKHKIRLEGSVSGILWLVDHIDYMLSDPDPNINIREYINIKMYLVNVLISTALSSLVLRDGKLLSEFDLAVMNGLNKALSPKVLEERWQKLKSETRLGLDEIRKAAKFAIDNPAPSAQRKLDLCILQHTPLNPDQDFIPEYAGKIKEIISKAEIYLLDKIKKDEQT